MSVEYQIKISNSPKSFLRRPHILGTVKGPRFLPSHLAALHKTPLLKPMPLEHHSNPSGRRKTHRHVKKLMFRASVYKMSTRSLRHMDVDRPEGEKDSCAEPNCPPAIVDKTLSSCS